MHWLTIIQLLHINLPYRYYAKWKTLNTYMYRLSRPFPFTVSTVEVLILDLHVNNCFVNFWCRFEIVGARMVWFTQEQAEVFLHIINAGSYKQVGLHSGQHIHRSTDRIIHDWKITWSQIYGSAFFCLRGRHQAVICCVSSKNVPFLWAIQMVVKEP